MTDKPGHSYLKPAGFLLASILTLLLAACGAQPVVDNSDKNPTAVIKAEGKIGGFVLPDSTFTEVSYTRPDRMRESTAHEYDSWFARQFFGNSKDTQIIRIDRKLRWDLRDDDGDKTYTECPLTGCSGRSIKDIDPAKNQDKQAEKPQLKYDPTQNNTSCPLKLVKDSFKVTDTGKTRKIAGYTAHEYTAEWLTAYKDPKGRVDSNRLIMHFWNTEPDARMKDVWKIKAEADRNYLKALGLTRKDLKQMLPDEVFSSLTAFINSNKMRQISKELGKIKGENIATSVAWYLDRKACIEPQKATKSTEKSFSWSNPLGALQDTAMDMASDKATEMFMPNPNEPVLSYQYEVKQVGVSYEHDSLFDVPADYKRVSAN